MTMNDKTIGVFDSGMGGLTVLRALMERLPGERLAYLGDTARVPYGARSPEVIVRYSLANARRLSQESLKLLVVACNTASSVAIPALREALSIPVVGVIEPGAEAAAKITRGRVGVIGTVGTVASGAYQAALERARSGTQVLSRACPLFVPLVEEGWTEGEVVEAVARKYLADFGAFETDTLVLGCTHYPLLKGTIGRVMGPGVTLVDSAEATAEHVARLLRTSGLLAPEGRTATVHRFLVTDLPDRFAQLGSRILDRPIEHAELVDL